MKTFLNNFCFSVNIMDLIFSRPLFTDVYERPEQFVPESGSAYIYGIFEERSKHVELWRNLATDVLFVELNETGPYTAGTDLPEMPTISLRDKTQFASFFSIIGRKTVYV